MGKWSGAFQATALSTINIRLAKKAPCDVLNSRYVGRNLCNHQASNAGW